MTEELRSPHPNALPNYEKAVISEDKLRKYALSSEHVSSVKGKSSGKDKALIFERRLGFNTTNCEILKQRILDELPYYEAKLGQEDVYGQKYEVVLPILGVNGETANIITAWIIDVGVDYPRLISTYVLKRK
ncbi:MAG TPA: hypothetical protein VF791_11395 [Pyrinomonadaceae bacterium]